MVFLFDSCVDYSGCVFLTEDSSFYVELWYLRLEIYGSTSVDTILEDDLLPNARIFISSLFFLSDYSMEKGSKPIWDLSYNSGFDSSKLVFILPNAVSS